MSKTSIGTIQVRDKAIDSTKLADDITVIGEFRGKPPLIAVSNSKILISPDENTFQNCININSIELTIPHSSITNFAIGAIIEIFRSAAGNVSVETATGVTLIAANGFKALSILGAHVTLRKLNINTWGLYGDIAPTKATWDAITTVYDKIDITWENIN